MPGKKKFKFLSIFKWEDRKGWDILLRAFMEEFSSEDDVSLHILTYLYSDPGPRETSALKRVKAKISEFSKTVVKCKGRKQTYGQACDLPNLDEQIFPMTDAVPFDKMPRLYRAANCFVLPTRGEGWGLPIAEAMAMQLPTIATAWGGQTEFMDETNSYPLPVDKMVHATGREFEHERGMDGSRLQWAEPSVKQLRQLMRSIYANPGAARAVGEKARLDMVAKFSAPAVASMVLERLYVIATNNRASDE